MNDTSPIALIPAFKTLDAFCAIGMSGEFIPGDSANIGQLWSQFAPRMSEVANRAGDATFGLCVVTESHDEAAALPDNDLGVHNGQDDQEDATFTYMAAVATTDLATIPAGMMGINIPARRYAVFEYTDGIGPQLGKTMQYIFGEWLPKSDYQQDGADFEYYDDAFDPNTGTGIFYIYIPVKT